MRRPALLVIATALVFSATGCGSNGRSVLDAGVTIGPRQKRHHVTPPEAIAAARSARAEWLEALRRSRRSPGHFRSPPRSVLVARLDEAARGWPFHVASLTLHRPVGLAPEIVIESREYVTLAQSFRQVLDHVDPPPRSNHRAYEAIFVEAVDERHVPFFVFFNSLRGDVAGGEWARADALYPFEHG